MAHKYVRQSGALVQTTRGLGIALFRYQDTLCVVLIARTHNGIPETVRLHDPGCEFRLPLGWNTVREVRNLRGLIEEAHRWQLRTLGKKSLGTLVDVMA
jgi:hypothetical protein